jgi:hypothetical protein
MYNCKCVCISINVKSGGIVGGGGTINAIPCHFLVYLYIFVMYNLSLEDISTLNRLTLKINMNQLEIHRKKF